MKIDNQLRSTYSSAASEQVGSGTRLFFIDNIRWLMIVFVVLMHLNVTYSGLGSWYYKEGGTVGDLSFLIFGLYGSLTQAYFMGLLFFIAGFFVALSYDKKGFSHFMKDRLVRLGIPTLVYMLILSPVIGLIKGYFNHDVLSNFGQLYVSYITSFDFLGETGPLWFAFALLIFSALYALVRLSINTGLPGSQKLNSADFITHTRVLILIILVSFLTFLVRLVQPLGTSVLNMQLGYFSQYIILFILGIVAFRSGFLAKLPHKFGITWFRLALLVGIPLWCLIMVLGGAFDSFTPFSGGLTWQALAYAGWESFFCAGIVLGLLVIFRDRFNSQNSLTHFLSQNAFAVYVFHAPLLVGITMLLRSIMIYPLLKMILVAMIVLPVCFGFSYLLRRIPVMDRLFS